MYEPNVIVYNVATVKRFWTFLALVAGSFAALAAPRIVSCAPAVTETLCDLGADACLVGRSSACLHPASVTNLPSVGAYSSPSLERIVSLSPTHVLMTYFSDPSMSNRLERMGVRVLQFPCERLTDYVPMRTRLAALCGIAPRRLLAVVQRQPLVVAGRDTLPDDILAEVGCANAVTNRTGYFVLTPEARLRLAPDGELDFGMDDALTRLGPQLPSAISRLRTQLAPQSLNPQPLNPQPLNSQLLRLRLWRLLAALIVGAALALAGATLQTVLRNPLADPFILGISGGASLAAAAVLATGLAATAAWILPGASFLGAVAALAFVAAVARAAQGGPITLILAGVVTGGITSSLLMLVISLSSSRALQSVTWWMMGNLQSAEPLQLAVTGACVAVATFALLSQARALNALALGSDLARTLGVRPERTIPLVLGAASLATAAAVSLAGVIGFVGLIVPHAVRRLVGANHRAVLPLSAVAGGIFLVACDQLGRLCGEAEIPAGVITALTGGPFFLWILIRHARPAK